MPLDASNAPSGLNAMSMMRSALIFSGSVRSFFPVATVQSLMTPPRSHDASSEPSGLNATFET